jgi:hypothetical protein
MGSAAVRALLDEISGVPAPRAEYIFRPELVVRSSTGPVRAAPTPALGTDGEVAEVDGVAVVPTETAGQG